MEFKLIDFFIGFTLMNGMSHLIISLTKIRFFGLFGYEPKDNRNYAFLNFLIFLILFQVQYGLLNILNNGIVVGSLFIVIAYLITGKYFVQKFRNHSN